MSCKKHQPKVCEKCVTEEIAQLEKKIEVLKKKLPPQDSNTFTFPVDGSWSSDTGNIIFYVDDTDAGTLQ
ncbi:hypothetical protein CL620_05235 [archaeon]|jgi:hypothetical protein|nr:hypothetical protein [archaeon]|tara:strand:- start:4947 stop:5156 length:210 start_codon:yes stop_codon:yes gene_type:complete